MSDEAKQQAKGLQARRRAYKILQKIIDTNSYLEKQINDLPAAIEEHVKRIVSSTFKPEDVSNFVLKELFEIYISANGKKTITEYLKDKPKELLNLLKTMNELATKLLELEKAKQPAQSQNNGVMVQFVGLSPDKTAIQSDTTPKVFTKDN